MGVTGRTVRDLVQDALAKSGAAEAHGFEVKFKDGSTYQILSDDSEILNEPASKVATVGIKQSAQAGVIAVAA